LVFKPTEDFLGTCLTLGKAVDMLKVLSEEESLFWIEEAKEKARRDEVARRAYAERVAREKGIAEGRAEGMERGRAEGRAEGMERISAIVKSMLDNGYTPEEVSRLTGLPVSELEHYGMQQP
jgi:predicted transposase/invertase (TIGR01784 family)